MLNYSYRQHTQQIKASQREINYFCVKLFMCVCFVWIKIITIKELKINLTSALDSGPCSVPVPSDRSFSHSPVSPWIIAFLLLQCFCTHIIIQGLAPAETDDCQNKRTFYKSLPTYVAIMPRDASLTARNVTLLTDLATTPPFRTHNKRAEAFPIAFFPQTPTAEPAGACIPRGCSIAPDIIIETQVTNHWEEKKHMAWTLMSGAIQQVTSGPGEIVHFFPMTFRHYILLHHFSGHFLPAEWALSVGGHGSCVVCKLAFTEWKWENSFIIPLLQRPLLCKGECLWAPEGLRVFGARLLDQHWEQMWQNSMFCFLKFIHPSMHLPVQPSMHSSIYSSICLSICSSICPVVYLSIHPELCLSGWTVEINKYGCH